MNRGGWRRPGVRATPAPASVLAACVLLIGATSCGSQDAVSTVDTNRPVSQSTPATAGSQDLGATTDEGEVIYVVDGDTLDVRGAGRVRILGIDTPERGECGFAEAGDRVRDLFLNQDVRLVLPEGTDNTDQYDRKLRYVVRADDGLDLGETLVGDGLATARYDSRDGYASHPLENRYRSLDEATQHPFC